MSERSSWLPSLNALRAFEAVARHGSFQKAAIELHVSSPAVQQLVRGLEEAVGRPLIVRNGRTVGVTDAGSLGVTHLKDGFRQLAQGVALIRSHQAPQQLRVSVEPSFAAGWLIGRLTSFHDAHPAINVLMDTSERLVDLVAGEADVAIRYGRAVQDGLVRQELFLDETIAVCSSKMTAQPRTVDDLRRHTLIHFDRPRTMQLGWDGWLEAFGAQPVRTERNLRFTDYNMMLQAAIAGPGIALASRPIVQGALDAGLLVALFGRGLNIGMTYSLVMLPEVADRPTVMAFANWLKDEVRPAQPADTMQSASCA